MHNSTPERKQLLEHDHPKLGVAVIEFENEYESESESESETKKREENNRKMETMKKIKDSGSKFRRKFGCNNKL